MLQLFLFSYYYNLRIYSRLDDEERVDWDEINSSSNFNFDAKSEGIDIQEK